jgi:hypothetical protein
MMRSVPLGRLFAIFVLGCCGCSMSPLSVNAPTKVGASAHEYGDMSCAELRTESAKIMDDSVNLHANVSSPPEIEQRVHELKAEMDKLNQAWMTNKC